MSLWENMCPAVRALNPKLDPARGARSFDEAAEKMAEPKRERDLQNQLYALLYRRGHRPRMQRMDRKSNLAIGMPDICFEFYGRSVHWEVKMPGKDPEPEQIAVMQALEREPNFAAVRVIRSYREGLDHLTELAASLSQPLSPEAPPTE